MFFNFCNEMIIANFVGNATAKEFRKSVNIWWSYKAMKLCGSLTIDHPLAANAHCSITFTFIWCATAFVWKALLRNYSKINQKQFLQKTECITPEIVHRPNREENKSYLMNWKTKMKAIKAIPQTTDDATIIVVLSKKTPSLSSTSASASAS